MIRRRFVLPLAWLLGVALLVPGQVRAQGGDEHAQNEAAATALFTEARKLLEGGDTKAACAKFEESQRLSAASGTLLNLASCHEKLGKTATAFQEWVESANGQQKDRAAVAKERLAALTPRLTRVIFEILADRPSGLEILLDGKPVDSAAWGTALPVDPGDHAIEARATGRKSWSSNVTLAGEGVSIRVSIPLLELAIPLPMALPVQGAPGSENPGAPAGSPARDERTSGLARGVGVGLLGLGGVAVIVGALFGESAAERWSDANCTNGICATEADQQLAQSAKRRADFSTACFVGSLGLVGGGVLALVLGHRHEDRAAAMAVGPAIGDGSVGVRAAARF